MSTGKRVLIVEDHPDVLETYKKSIIRAGFIVDTASTKEEAFEKVRRRTYHVAMIDVNLTDFSGGDGNDRSGIDLVKRIKSLKEGTKCVVISGEKSSEVPVDAQEAGYDRYIIKKRIRVPDDYIEPVKQLADSCVLQSTGQFADLIAYFSFPEERWSWENNLMRVLKCDGAGLTRALKDVFGNYLPLLRQRNASYSLMRMPGDKQLTGAFWSKAVARPIWVAVGQKGEELDKPSESAKSPELLSSRMKGPVQFSVWGIDNLMRSDFFESPDDLRQ